jgi:hypothetical protein
MLFWLLWEFRLNASITHYFEVQYAYLLAITPKGVVTLLSKEDKFFVDLYFRKVLIPRRKACFDWYAFHYC